MKNEQVRDGCIEMSTSQVLNGHSKENEQRYEVIYFWDTKQSVKRAPLKMPFSCYNKFSILENYEMSSNYEKINAEENLSMKQQKVDHTSQNKKRSHFRNNWDEIKAI